MALDSSTNQEQAILVKARALAPAERAAFLQGACGQDQELRQRIEARLKAEAIQLPQGNREPGAGPGGTVVAAIGLPDEHRGQAGTAARPAASDAGCHGRFLPGARVAGRYRIVSLAGKGGMGEVYRADDLKLGHSVALKFLPSGLEEHSQLLEYFLNEVRLSRQIAHPNVCRVYDVGELEGQHFLSMEYIDGEDLRSLLRRIGRLPQDKGIQIAQQVCAGLAAAHAKGVLHRDLKPANIMIDGQGQARITDFGLARLATGGGAGEVVGTPSYMAPEQWARGETSVQSDLYSLGLVLFEMFTGQPVHEAESIADLQRAHQRSPVLPSTLVPDLHPAVERVILQCLQKDPRQRPRSARAVAAALPGADPLAAALAAGETPSPELVAAAGGEGILKTRIGLTCLAGVAAGLILACCLAQKTYRVNRAGLDKHPEALAAEARQIIQQLGYSAKPADWEFGFADRGENGMDFFYRQSPQAIIVFDFYSGFNALSYGKVLEHVPHWAVPGELGVVLDPRGKLLSFRAVPPLIPDPQLREREPDWTNWFAEEELGFDLARLEKTSDKMLRPPDPYDHLQVWRGVSPQTNAFYVEAAAYSGRPVYFEVLEPSRFAPAVAARTLTPEAFMGWLYLVVIAGGVVLAWRNLRLRRSDRRGAFRVAFYFFCIGMLISAIHAHHTVGPAEGGVFEMGLAQAAARAIVFWLWYTALEPYARRLWPQTLISWTRLLEGRWRDPLVGRDMLIGCLFGLARNLALQLHLLAPKWLGLGMHRFQTSPAWSLDGAGSWFADCLFKQIDAVFFAMFFLMSLLLLRFLFRKTLLASIVFLALFTPVYVLAGGPPSMIDWLAGALAMGLIFWALVQWGFLASAVSLLCANLLTFPLTTHWSAWYAPHGLAALALVGLIALLGFFNSSDKPISRLPDPI
jgi:serine/threonine-protein kinase